VDELHFMSNGCEDEMTADNHNIFKNTISIIRTLKLTLIG